MLTFSNPTLTSTTIDNNYQADTTYQLIYADTSSGGYNLVLPPLNTTKVGFTLYIKNISTATNDVIVSAFGAELINGIVQNIVVSDETTVYFISQASTLPATWTILVEDTTPVPIPTPIPSIPLMYYNLDNGTTPVGLPAGVMRLNNNNQTLATELYVSIFDQANSTNYSQTIFSNIQKNTILTIQVQADVTKYAKYKVISNTDNTTYFTYGLELISANVFAYVFDLSYLGIINAVEMYPAITSTQSVYVNNGFGIDSAPNNGSADLPYASIAYALSQITDNAANKQYVIYVAPGFYIEFVQISIKPFVSIIGVSQYDTTKVVNVSGDIDADASFFNINCNCLVKDIVFLNNFNISAPVANGFTFDLVFENITAQNITVSGRNLDTISIYNTTSLTNSFNSVSASLYSSVFNSLFLTDTAPGDQASLSVNSCNTSTITLTQSNPLYTMNLNYFGTRSTTVDTTGTTDCLLSCDNTIFIANISVGTAISRRTNAFYHRYLPIAPGNWPVVPNNVADALDTLAVSAASAVDSVTNAASVNAPLVTGTATNPIIRRLEAGTNVALTTTATDITIDVADAVNSVTNAVSANTALVTGTALDPVVKRLAAGTNITLASNATDVTINTTALVESVTNTVSANEALVGGTATNPTVKRLEAGNNILLSSTATDITIDTITLVETVTNAVSANEALVVGTATDPVVKRLAAGTNITLSATATDITVNTTALVESVTNAVSANTAIITGTATNPVAKRLAAGTNVTLTPTATDITIDVTGGGSVNSVTNAVSANTALVTGTATDPVIKRLAAGTGINLTNTATDVNIINTIVALDDLSDVVISAPSIGAPLVYNGANFANNNNLSFVLSTITNNATANPLVLNTTSAQNLTLGTNSTTRLTISTTQITSTFSLFFNTAGSNNIFSSAASTMTIGTTTANDLYFQRNSINNYHLVTDGITFDVSNAFIREPNGSLTVGTTTANNLNLMTNGSTSLAMQNATFVYPITGSVLNFSLGTATIRTNTANDIKLDVNNTNILSVKTTGLQFTNSGLAGYTPTSLNTFEKFSYTSQIVYNGTLTAVLSATSHTVKAVRIGDMITITFTDMLFDGAFTLASSATDVYFVTGLPSRFTPTGEAYNSITMLQNNDVQTTGLVHIDTGGNIFFTIQNTTIERTKQLEPFIYACSVQFIV